MRFLEKIREKREMLAIGSVGMMVFLALNAMMLSYHYDVWTNPKVGFWSAFTKYFHISGFDVFTYVTVSQWRPLYNIERHPLLSVFVWPLSALNEWLMSAFHMNCAIIIVGALWAILSTTAWCLLYKMMRTIVGLGWRNSLLMCFFYFSIAYVMLVTIVPDHMLLSMTLLLVALWITCKSGGKSTWTYRLKIMLVYFFSTGVTLTNSVKVWLADMVACCHESRSKGKALVCCFRKSLIYLIPTMIIGGAYLWQVDNTVKSEKAHAEEMTQKRIEKDSVFAKQYAENQARKERMHQNMVVDNELFLWTDTSIDRWPLLYENILGEGFFLHEDHLLGDANADRPVFVYYGHGWFYLLEAILFLLMLAGIWAGRHSILMQATLSMVLFDAIIHYVFRFAASDVYIMTAHWAFIYPISIAFLMKKMKEKRAISIMLTVSMLVITVIMWTYNLHLISSYLIK